MTLSKAISFKNKIHDDSPLRLFLIVAELRVFLNWFEFKSTLFLKIVYCKMKLELKILGIGHALLQGLRLFSPFKNIKKSIDVVLF